MFSSRGPYTKPSKPCNHFEVRGTATFALEDASCATFSICFDLIFLRYRTNSTNINSTLQKQLASISEERRGLREKTYRSLVIIRIPWTISPFMI